MKMKIRHLLGAALIGAAVTLKLMEPAEPAPLGYEFVTLNEFWDAVDRERTICDRSGDPRAALSVHLAGEGYRLGYLEGLERGMWVVEGGDPDVE